MTAHLPSASAAPADRGPIVPRHLDDVTASWLTGLLATTYPGIEVRALGIVECKNSHTTKLRVRLELNEVGRNAGIPENVCLKANWSGMHTGQICEREARFYGLVGTSGQLPIPTSYFSAWNTDDSGNGVVVMEDLALQPGRFGASTDELGIGGVAAGLETLAALHGALWNDERLTTSEWLPGSMDTENDTDQVIQYWNYIQHNLSDPSYATVVPSWVHERPELMAFALDELSAYEQELPGPRCLVHGDAHQGNSFTRANGQRLWVDWQLVRRGTPWRDVSYFIVSSLSVSDRRTADRELVEHYRRALLATGAEGVASADDAWQQYLRWPAYGSQAWLGNVNQWGQQAGATMVERQFAASEDYDTVGLLTKGRSPRRVFVPGAGAYRLPRALRPSGTASS